jgi:hypothetical protein
MTYALIQKEIMGATRPDHVAGEMGYSAITFSPREIEDWKLFLQNVDRDLTGPCQIHCAIEVADFISRSCPKLAKHLFYRPNFLHHIYWTSLIPRKFQLNTSWIALPLGEILSRKTMIETLFGDKLFLRPDSCRKIFPGYQIDLQNLEGEIGFLTSLGVQKTDLVILDRARSLAPVEFRFWIAQGEIVTFAPYALEDRGVPKPGQIGPSQMRDACQLAQRILEESPYLETLDERFVFDIGHDLVRDQQRLVEVNAWSTSGFYPHADIEKILGI